MSISVLSTKRLAAPQRERLLAVGLGVVDYNSIAIEHLKSPYKPQSGAGVIITSGNAIHVLDNLAPGSHPVFCVGDKTAEKLSAKGWKPGYVAENSASLAEFLVRLKPVPYYSYPCGNLRRDELPDKLKANKIPLEEHIAYQTTPFLRTFGRIFDGVMFYSPSGVYAFAKANKASSKLAFCIGETTANAAKNYFEEVHIAKTSTISSVILTTLKYFNDRRQHKK